MAAEKKRTILFPKEVWAILLLASIVAYQFLREDLRVVYFSGLVAFILYVYGMYTMYDLALKTSSAQTTRSNISEMPSRDLTNVQTDDELKRRSLFWLWLEAAGVYVFRLVFIILSLAFLAQVLADLRPSVLHVKSQGIGIANHLLFVVSSWWQTFQWMFTQVGLHPDHSAEPNWRDGIGAILLLTVYGTYAFAVTSCAGALVKIGLRRAELKRRLAGAVRKAAAPSPNS